MEWFKSFDPSLLGSPITQRVKKRLFWINFWKLFKHPAMIYMYGVVLGLTLHSILNERVL